MCFFTCFIFFHLQVYLSHNNPPLVTPLPSNVEQVPGIQSLGVKSVTFQNGREEDVDVVLCCTGYRYDFPFFTKECEVHVDDERVTPLYKHLIHTKYPSLSIIGVCKVIVPFPQFHVQVKFVLSTLDGSLKLPSKEEMDQDTKADFEKRLSKGLPSRHAHHMGSRQWDYNDDLLSLGQFNSLPNVVHKLYDHIHNVRIKDLIGYKNDNYDIVDSDTYLLRGKVN